MGEAHRKGLEEAEATSSPAEQPPEGSDEAPAELVASQQEEGEVGEREEGREQDGEGGEDGQLPDRGQSSGREEEQEARKENKPEKEVSTPVPAPPTGE